MNTKFEVDMKDYSDRGYMTPNQIRDLLTSVLILDAIGQIKNAANDEQARRKALPEQYIQCSYCKGYHDGLKNIDGLCEDHERQLAPYRYDVEHFGKEKALEMYRAEV